MINACRTQELHAYAMGIVKKSGGRWYYQGIFLCRNKRGTDAYCLARLLREQIT